MLAILIKNYSFYCFFLSFIYEWVMDIINIINDDDDDEHITGVPNHHNI